LVGHEGHEEVEGTAGEAPDAVQLVDGPEGIAKATVRDPKKVIWLSQTTLSVDETMETVIKLREKFPTLQNPPSDDICYATQNRQVAIKKVGAESDLVIVVGSANSSNTVRLVEVALDAGAKAAYRVDDASEIQASWFEGVKTVGVSSGASVPEDLVDGVLAYLAEGGYGDVRTVTTAEEDVQFSLPKELRKDLKAAGEDVSNKGPRN
jgi:4-hydroxy-3-methylbut-2-enyl diphosphate reductase